MRSDTLIRKEGLEALKSRLDPVETEKFLMLVRRDSFDYTEWQRGLWEKQTVSDIFKKGREANKPGARANGEAEKSTKESAQLETEIKNCHCTDASIAPVLAIRKPGKKWQLFGISEVHGMGNASHEKNLFGEEYDEIVPLNSMKGLSYILYRQGKKWGLVQIRDNRTLECEIKRVKGAAFDSQEELLRDMKVNRKDYF